MPGKHSRDKGAQFEREIAIALRDIFPRVEREDESNTGKGVDLRFTGQLDVQCKRFAGSVPMSKLYEVPIVPGRIALLVSRSDRGVALATLRMADFVKILEDVGVAFDDEQLGLTE